MRYTEEARKNKGMYARMFGSTKKDGGEHGKDL